MNKQEKIELYIDFEEVSSPFNWDLKRWRFPYAYTIGVFVNKDFKTKTTIVDFKKIWMKYLYCYLQKKINLDICELLNNKNFKIASETTKFKAFGYELEKNIVNRLFKNVEITEINKGMQISLEKVTEYKMPKKEYFPLLRNAVKNNWDENFIKRRNLNKSGALAALAGYILYLKANKNSQSHYKYEVSIGYSQLIKEVSDYSKDDVLRMKIIDDNYDLFCQKYEKFQENLKNLQKITKKLELKKVIIENLMQEDPQIKIKSYIEKLKTKYS